MTDKNIYSRLLPPVPYEISISDTDTESSDTDLSNDNISISIGTASSRGRIGIETEERQYSRKMLCRNYICILLPRLGLLALVLIIITIASIVIR
jgi:hypothetical protein